MTLPSLDPERQRQAKAYARLQRRWGIASLALSGAYALLWLVTGAAPALRSALERISPHFWLQVALFGAAFAGLYALLSLPLDFYTSFTLPHRFGLSTQTLRGWIVDQLKGALIGAPLGLVFLELIYLLLRTYPATWWLIAAAVLLVFNVLLSNLAPVLIMPLFNKFTPLGEERADLVERLMRLAERAGARVRGVYQMDMSRRTRAANAALTGLGNTRRIILGDTLLKEFSDDEIETVLAHELGHHVHRDIPLLILANSALTLLGLWLASLGLVWGAGLAGLRGPADPASLPVLLLVFGLYGLVTTPLGNAFSRWRESLADEYALQATGKAEAFAAALTRLANQNLAEAEPERWVEIIYFSHPALGRRIARAKEAAARSQQPQKEPPYAVT